jgi:hypothetical protein
MQIEVNALRVTGGTIAFGPGKFANVSAKARILKGTAVSDATLDTTLTVEAVDGTTVIRTSSTGPITLGVGKGGKGAKLSMEIPQCDSGFIEFVATFFGLDADNVGPGPSGATSSIQQNAGRRKPTNAPA